VAEDWLLFVEALDWVCPCFCELLSLFVLAMVLLRVLLRLFVLFELPELLTPDVDVALPPVAVALPPVAVLLAPEVELLLAPDVELEVLVLDGGVVTGVVGVGTQIKAMPSTTS
jgi:hypothetical protein